MESLGWFILFYGVGFLLLGIVLVFVSILALTLTWAIVGSLLWLIGVCISWLWSKISASTDTPDTKA
jgi:hypothetical protein